MEGRTGIRGRRNFSSNEEGSSLSETDFEFDPSEPGAVDAEPKLKPRKKAREKLMDYLARRDHSELELREKLSKDYSQEEIDEAIEDARAKKWLVPDDELAERVAAGLRRKGKGQAYVDQFLESRGLPSVGKDPESEIEKGLELVRSKLGKTGPFDYEEQQKIYRLLASRGYESDSIRAVIDRAREQQN